MHSFLRGMIVVWGVCALICSMVASAALISWVGEQTNWVCALITGILILSLYGGLYAWMDEPNIIKIRLGRKK